MSELQLSIPLLITGEAAAALAVVGLLRRGIVGAVPFAVLMAAAAWWSFAQSMEVLADDAGGKFAWLRIQYAGAVLMAPAWLALVWQFRKRQSAMPDRLLGLLAIEPIVVLMLIWTDGVHGLMWGTPGLDTTGATALLTVQRGVGFWAHSFFVLLLMGAATVVLVKDLAETSGALRRQTMTLAGAGALAIVGMAACLAGVVPVNIDVMPVVFTLVGLASAAALFRYHLLSVAPIARDAVMSGMTEGAIVLDSTGRIVDMNPAAERIVGVSVDSALGAVGDDVLTEFGKVGNDVPLPSISYAEIRGTAQARNYEVRLSRMHNTDGRSHGRLVVLRDVTAQKEAEGQLHEAKARLEQDVQRQTAKLTQELQERKFAEIALRDSEERSRQVIDTAYDAFVSMNANGAVIDWNPQAENVFGWSREEILGKDVAEHLLPVRSREEHRRGLRYYLTSSEGLKLNRPVEMAALHRDGHEFEAEMTMSPGIVKGLRVFNMFVHDITERKQTEQALRDSNTQLGQALGDLESAQRQVIQQERLRAVGEMASGIAHEFNNALSPIVGFSELLIMKPKILSDEAKSKRYLEGIRTAALDAANVVSRLREFYRSREVSEAREPIDLNALVSQTVTLTQPRWRGQAQADGVSVRVSTELAGRPIVQGDASSIREVLTNLIFNAVDAMPNGGRVVVRTTEHEDHVLLEVADTGAGMSDEVLMRCLDPFFSTKGEKGTGLGLSLVHGIMERHGGTVDIESEVGKGTTFKLTFPVSALPEPLATVIPADDEPSSRALHVMAVDDDRAVLEVIEAILQAEGHNIVLANSAREALEELKRNKIDLVITDLAMPLMNGDKLAQLMKRMRPGLPVIMLTGFAEMLDESEASASVDIVVSKPVSPAKLRDAFETVLSAA